MCELVVHTRQETSLSQNLHSLVLSLKTSANTTRTTTTILVCVRIAYPFLFDWHKRHGGWRKTRQENENIFICLSLRRCWVHCFIFSSLWNWRISNMRMRTRWKLYTWMNVDMRMLCRTWNSVSSNSSIPLFLKSSRIHQFLAISQKKTRQWCGVYTEQKFT